MTYAPAYTKVVAPCWRIPSRQYTAGARCGRTRSPQSILQRLDRFGIAKVRRGVLRTPSGAGAATPPLPGHAAPHAQSSTSQRAGSAAGPTAVVRYCPLALALIFIYPGQELVALAHAGKTPPSRLEIARLSSISLRPSAGLLEAVARQETRQDCAILPPRRQGRVAAGPAPTPAHSPRAPARSARRLGVEHRQRVHLEPDPPKDRLAPGGANASA